MCYSPVSRISNRFLIYALVIMISTQYKVEAKGIYVYTNDTVSTYLSMYVVLLEVNASGTCIIVTTEHMIM